MSVEDLQEELRLADAWLAHDGQMRVRVLGGVVQLHDQIGLLQKCSPNENIKASAQTVPGDPKTPLRPLAGAAVRRRSGRILETSAPTVLRRCRCDT